MVNDCTYISLDGGVTSSEYTNEHSVNGIVNDACSAGAIDSSVAETELIHAKPENRTPLGVTTRRWKVAPWVLHSLRDLSNLSSDQASTMIVLRVHGKKVADSVCAPQIARMGEATYAQLVDRVNSEPLCPPITW
jgi:hypothetical protein